MSIAFQQTGSIVLPLSDGPFTVAILHRGYWRETLLTCPFSDAVDAAQDAYQRSGLPVQVRDTDGTLLYEASDGRDDWTIE